MWIQTPKETNHEIKLNISPVSDIDVEKSCFFLNVKLIFLKNNVLFISVSGTHFLKQLFADVLKIGALKNCAILWITRRFKLQVFSCK